MPTQWWLGPTKQTTQPNQWWLGPKQAVAPAEKPLASEDWVIEPDSIPEPFESGTQQGIRQLQVKTMGLTVQQVWDITEEEIKNTSPNLISDYKLSWTSLKNNGYTTVDFDTFLRHERSEKAMLATGVPADLVHNVAERLYPVGSTLQQAQVQGDEWRTYLSEAVKQIPAYTIKPGDVGLPGWMDLPGGGQRRPSVDFTFGVDWDIGTDIYVYHNNKKVGILDIETGDIKLDDPQYVLKAMTPDYWERQRLKTEGRYPAEPLLAGLLKISELLDKPIPYSEIPGTEGVPWTTRKLLGLIGGIGSMALMGFEAFTGLRSWMTMSAGAKAETAAQKMFDQSSNGVKLSRIWGKDSPEYRKMYDIWRTSGLTPPEGQPATFYRDIAYNDFLDMYKHEAKFRGGIDQVFPKTPTGTYQPPAGQALLPTGGGVTPITPTITGFAPTMAGVTGQTVTGIAPAVTGITGAITTTGEGIPMPGYVQQGILSQANTWLQQVSEVKPNSLHRIGIAEGEAFIRTDSQSNPLVVGTSLMRDNQLTLSTIVAVQGKELAVGKALIDVGNYIKENNIAFPPRAEMSPEAIRIYDKLIGQKVPEYAPTTAMAEWGATTGKPETIPNNAITEAEDLFTKIGEEWIGGKPGVGLTNNQISRAKAGIAQIAKKYSISKDVLWRNVWWEQEIKPEVLEPPLTNDQIEELIKSVSGKQGVTPKAISKAEVGMPEIKVTPVTPEVPSGIVPPIEPDVLAIPKELPTIPPPLSPEGDILGRTPNEWPGFMADLQDAQTVVDIYTRNDMIRKWVKNLPGMKGLMTVLNPQVVANTPAEKAIIVRATLRDEGYQKTQGVIAYLNEIGRQEKIFGSLDSKGFIKSGVLKGQTVGDIAQSRAKWESKLTDEQKFWLDRAKTIENATVELLNKNGIDVKLLHLDEGGQFATRRVWAKTLNDGTVIDVAYVGPTTGRIGARLPTEKHRIFKTEKEAIDSGYRYIPYEEALYLKVVGTYNRIADKKMADWLLTQVPWRTTGAPEELVLAAESARLKLRHSQMLLAGLNRAVRGERLPDVTIKAISTSYPDQGKGLKDLVPRLQAGEETASEVQSLTNTAKGLINTNKLEYARAVSARARAREAAMTVRMGEAMIPAPAFQGKILTGPDAKETAKVLRQSFEPSFSKSLGEVNKFNAVARYFMLAGDFSPFTIQLIFLMGENPVIYAKAFGGAVKALLDPTYQANFLSKHKATIDKHPNLLISKGGTTEFTEAMARGGWLSGKTSFHPENESYWKSIGLFLPRSMSKVGGIVLTPFQRVFEQALDSAGIYLAGAYDHLCTTPERTADVDNFINEFRGLTSSARIGVSGQQRQLETALLLAPRYNRAIAGLLFDLSRGNIRGHLARKSLIKGIAALVAMGVLISIARGEDKDEILEHFNPNSSMFFTWNVAGQKVGPGSKIRSLMKLLAQSVENPDDLLKFSMDNPALRFVRGNLAPVISSSIDLLTGKSYIGDPTRDGILSFTKEILAGNLLPIWLQSALFEGGSPGGRTIRGLVEFFGGRAYPEPIWDEVGELRDKYAKEDFSTKYKDLNRAQIDDLLENHPDLKELEIKAELESAARGTEFEQWFYKEREAVIKARNDKLEEGATLLLNGTITKYDYDSERGYTRPYYSGGMAVLYSARDSLDPDAIKDINKWLATNQKPEDKALDAYQEYRAGLIEKSELPRDWDAIEAQCEVYLAKLSPKIREYINANLNSWINDLPENAKRVELMRLQGIEDETWWDDYRGVSGPGEWWTGGGTTAPTTIGPTQWWTGQ